VNDLEKATKRFQTKSIVIIGPRKLNLTVPKYVERVCMI
jgi:hypothetical protein